MVDRDIEELAFVVDRAWVRFKRATDEHEDSLEWEMNGRGTPEIVRLGVAMMRAERALEKAVNEDRDEAEGLIAERGTNGPYQRVAARLYEDDEVKEEGRGESVRVLEEFEKDIEESTLKDAERERLLEEVRELTECIEGKVKKKRKRRGR